MWTYERKNKYQINNWTNTQWWWTTFLLEMTQEEFISEMLKGVEDFENGRTLTIQELQEELEKEFQKSNFTK